jgi:hypothetical protein
MVSHIPTTALVWPSTSYAFPLLIKPRILNGDGFGFPRIIGFYIRVNLILIVFGGFRPKLKKFVIDTRLIIIIIILIIIIIIIITIIASEMWSAPHSGSFNPERLHYPL